LQTLLNSADVCEGTHQFWPSTTAPIRIYTDAAGESPASHRGWGAWSQDIPGYPAAQAARGVWYADAASQSSTLLEMKAITGAVFSFGRGEALRPYHNPNA
jgi:hypothetical protein